MAPEARNPFSDPMFEPKVFREQPRVFPETVLKKVLATLLGLFGARGIVHPLPPRYTPADE